MSLPATSHMRDDLSVPQLLDRSEMSASVTPLLLSALNSLLLLALFDAHHFARGSLDYTPHKDRTSFRMPSADLSDCSLATHSGHLFVLDENCSTRQ